MIAAQQLTRDIAAFLGQGGAVLCGFADLTVLPGEIRRHLPAGIVFAMPIDPAIAASLTAGPTRAYAVEYARLNAALMALGLQCAEFVAQRGYQAIAQAGMVNLFDRSTLSMPLPHKTVATRAGLGWIGKCALLVTEEYGSAIRLNSVLTDAPLVVGTPIVDSRCGECAACRLACPGGAPTGKHWQAGIPRQDFFDAHACAATAGELAGALDIPDIICGRCIAACPWTQGYLRLAMETPMA